jgi:hypothetical protein
LALFFVTMLFFVAVPKFTACHTGMWPVKGIYYAGLIVVAFLIPNSFYVAYANVARAGSVLFIILQMILIIDFTYRWNESWATKALESEKSENESESKKWYGAILGVCAFMWIASIVGWALMYNYLASGSSCGTEKFAISLTLVLCAGFTLISISGYVEYGALLPSSAITLYCTFLLFTGLKNNPNTTCNQYSLGTTTFSDSDPLQITLGLLFAALSITYSCYSMSSDSKILFGGSSDSQDKDKVKYDDDVEQDSPKNKKDEKKEAKADPENEETEPEEVMNSADTRKANVLFHIIMLLASMYFGMLLTDWASNLYDNSNSISSIGTANMWVNIGSAWTISLLYIWTLVAPKLCTCRDFSQ